MSPAPTTVTIPADRLHATVRAIFGAAGSSEREAGLIADHLVEANLRGHDSHGVGMIPAYVANVHAGHLVLNQDLAVALDTGTILVCDGGQGAGQAMAHDAMALGIERARAAGSCIVGLRNSHHVGRIGHWAEQCAAAGIVSLHFVSVWSEPAVAPFGGTAARLGTNPFAVGLPRTGQPPIVVDFATSRWAVGKVRVAFNKGEPVPPGDPGRRRRAPDHGPRARCSAARPARCSPSASTRAGAWRSPASCSPARSPGPGRRRAARATAAILNSMFSVLVSPDGSARRPPSPRTSRRWRPGSGRRRRDGEPAVRLPGEPERETRARRLRDGIPIDPATWEQIGAAGASVGLSAADLLPAG